MKKNDTSSDIEDGRAVGVIVRVPETVLSSIFRKFNHTITKASTQQKVLLLLCVAGTILDPLFFYIPMINEGSKCMKSDRKLGVIAISLRSLVDVLHLLQWSCYYKEKWKIGWFKFIGWFKCNTSTTAAAATSKEISKGNHISFELLCIIPLPQAATLAILIIKGFPRSQQAVTLLKFSVLSQFILRTFRLFPSFHEATKNSITLLKNRFWIGAGFNLLLFVISSHVLGAFWYLLSMGRMMDCWKSACMRRVGCNIDSLYCGGPMDNKSYLDDYCPIQQATNSSAFDFGIYRSALESNIIGSIRFSLKFSYCFWWGLRNLSSLGQNLTTSAYEWEIFFSICISILGLILFSLFIGNMQAYFQYQTNEHLKNMEGKHDKIMKKQKELSNWQPFQWLSQNLKEEIISCVDDNWLETSEVDLKSTLDNLPEDLGRKIKHEIFLKMQNKVKLFQALNARALFRSIRLVKPEVFAEGSHVIKKGNPIDKMVFILNGKLRKQISTDGSMSQVFRVWDFFGEELLKDIVSGSSLIKGPLSTADIETCTKVEAFILDKRDLQNLVNQSKDTIINYIKRSIEEPKKVRAAAMQKQKKADLETVLTKWARFKESRTIGANGETLTGLTKSASLTERTIGGTP